MELHSSNSISFLFPLSYSSQYNSPCKTLPLASVHTGCEVRTPQRRYTAMATPQAVEQLWNPQMIMRLVASKCYLLTSVGMCTVYCGVSSRWLHISEVTLFFDYFLTFDLEVKSLWKTPLTGPSVLFLLVCIFKCDENIFDVIVLTFRIDIIHYWCMQLSLPIRVSLS